MEKYIFFIGIDVSKRNLDFCLRSKEGQIRHLQVSNDEKGIKEAVLWMALDHSFSPNASLVCMEHTGIYCQTVLHSLHSRGFDVWIEVAECIKNGTGRLARGKNDKIDAARIAEYASQFTGNARCWQPPRAELVMISDLMAARKRLVEVGKQLKVPVQEILLFKERKHAALVKSASKKTSRAAAEETAQIEREVMEIVKADHRLDMLYEIVTSVTGVGFVTGMAMIVATEEFTRMLDPRKFACHAGCAPFEHNSGSSVRGRTRVSKKADRDLKSLLHLCARAAVKCKGEMRDYYHRRIQEGKPKMSILNAVSNKIIHRVFACVREQRMYVK